MKPYYEEAGITIYCADCRDVLPGVPRVDLVLTDPPYGVGLTGKRTKRESSFANAGYLNFDDDPEYVVTVVVPMIQACIAQFGRVVVMPGHRHLRTYPASDDVGCVFNPAGAGRGPWGFSCFNPILYYGKDPNMGNGLGGRPNGFSELAYPTFPLGAGDGIQGHPCPKPLRWMRWLVKKASMAGDLILDPFMGSGTTLVAAKQLGRRAIGIEIERKYCDIAIERLRQDVLPLEAAVEPQVEQEALIFT